MLLFTLDVPEAGLLEAVGFFFLLQLHFFLDHFLDVALLVELFFDRAVLHFHQLLVIHHKCLLA